MERKTPRNSCLKYEFSQVNILLACVFVEIWSERSRVLGAKLSRVVGDAVRSRGRHLLGVSLITGRLVRAASFRVLVVMRNALGLLPDAARRGMAVHRSVGAIADLPLAIDVDWAVCAGAVRQIRREGLDVERRPLSLGQGAEVVVLLRRELLLMLLIASSEKFDVGGSASDAGDTRLLASGDLDKASGRRDALVV